MVTRNDFAVIAIQNVWGEGVGGVKKRGKCVRQEMERTGESLCACVHVCMCAYALVCLYGWVCAYVVKVSTYM